MEKPTSATSGDTYSNSKRSDCMGHGRYRALLSLCGLLTAIALPAHGEPYQNSVQVGMAQALFNIHSGELSGPPGTTPGGIKSDVQDKKVLALIYERRLAGPWGITLQGGLPPVLSVEGAGVAANMGKIGSVRAWFPAVMVTYHWDLSPQWSLHAGAGFHYTMFSDAKVNGTYNTAFGGTRSRTKFSPDFGPVAKVGATWSFDEHWFSDFSYTHYWLKTRATVDTDTPGVGTIRRKIDVRADPDVLSFTVGYRF